MFFNRSKPQNEPAPRTGLTDGIEDKIATFVREWGALKRSGRDYTPDGSEQVLKLLTDADTAYFVKAMEDETAAIEDEISAQIAEIKRKNLAEIAQKDAEIAAINREIETTKARIAAQHDEINRRAGILGRIIDAARSLAPNLVIDKLSEDEIMREVVRNKMGDEAVNGRAPAYIEARFDILASALKVDPFARVVSAGVTTADQGGGKAAADRAYAEYVQSLRDAHKGTQH
ncbi:hypothetical protein HJA89_10170 [Rhizobium bangladeshense]|uniref:hypothetical protein n=1 Tax=Rhizobium TaxID=379 RepID=UPI001C833D2B|nr:MULTISPECIES: hypothetical protein [Rhizobium]MBX4873266.1 hypothetical protein [Rhizobium bangladeshense]MBX4884643.1 hypothetical protein [Rhizobium bangladeshense]MBX5146356.1 hypothetical protein [Rhizobium lentis]